MSSFQGQQIRISGRPTWAEIHLDNLAANFEQIRNRVSPAARIMAIVKADAYGHGALECSRRLAKSGADWFGVAIPEEGIPLRAAGITQPILCLGGFWSDQAAACVQHRLTPVVYRLDMLESLDHAAKDAGIIADAHVKIDTGMGRLGAFRRTKRIRPPPRSLSQRAHRRVDESSRGRRRQRVPTVDPRSNPSFRRSRGGISSCRLPPNLSSSLQTRRASTAIAKRGETSCAPAACCTVFGAMCCRCRSDPKLAAVMSLHSRISMLKWVLPGETIGYGCTFEASRSLIATLPIGYHDGYMRALSNRDRARHVAPVVGRISMDLTLIDVTNVSGVELGDKVPYSVGIESMLDQASPPRIWRASPAHSRTKLHAASANAFRVSIYNCPSLTTTRRVYYYSSPRGALYKLRRILS